ncbi:hypothetical protein [Derxia lacustris]|uniref:hypothetical protein n=1 Tax=Derxia lacustris TaxID=764842 RepID=UPI000A177D56|nr:hypothetical protein [Derxia lacustris]
MTLQRLLPFAGIAVLLAAWALWPAAAPQPETAPAAALAAPRGMSFDFALPASGPAPVVPLKCEQARLRWRDGDSAREQCLAAPRTRQNGSVRSHLLDAAGDDARWSLRIDSLGDTPVAAELLANGKPAYACRGDACTGLRIGAHDARGQREIALDGVPLAALLPDGKPLLPRHALLVSARFLTQPEDRIAGLACAPDDSVSINTSAGAMLSFCARGGAGTELGEHGERTLSFASLDGGTLAVTQAADGTVMAVDYLGAQRFGCRAKACGGIALLAGGTPQAALRFLGTQLVELRDDGVAGASTVLLNGALRLPALD